MPDPQPIKAILDNRLGQILAERGTDTSTINDDDPTEVERAVAYTDSRIPARYRAAEVGEDAIFEWVMRVIKTDTAAHRNTVGLGPSLLILGPTGVGKTHQAYGAIRHLAGYGVRVAWIAACAADLFARLRPRAGADSHEQFTTVADAPLLMIDDLGAAKGSDWTEEITYRLINHRYEHMLPTIITSNVPPTELAARLGDRVASRLVEMCDRVVLKGKDRRRT